MYIVNMMGMKTIIVTQTPRKQTSLRFDYCSTIESDLKSVTFSEKMNVLEMLSIARRKKHSMVVFGDRAFVETNLFFLF